MKKYPKTLVAALLLPITSASWSCAYLQIQIANATNQICHLVSSDVIHGSLLTAPPAALFPGNTRSFYMSQTLYGPHITVQYRCSNEIVTLTSQQNYCALEAGDISASVGQPFPRSMRVDYIKQTGSYYWDTPGMVSWVISSNNQH